MSDTCHPPEVATTAASLPAPVRTGLPFTTRLEQRLRAPTASTLGQFVRYLFVGGTAFVADFGTLVLLAETGLLPVLPAVAAGFLVGTLVNHAIAVRWVFHTRSVSDARLEFVLFAALGLCGLGLNQLLIWAMTTQLAVHYLVAKLVTTGIVLGWNFFARKLLLFRG